MQRDRRQFLKDSGRGIAVAGIFGPAIFLSPAEARERHLPLKVLSEEELLTLEAAADILLPGAATLCRLLQGFATGTERICPFHSRAGGAQL